MLMHHKLYNMLRLMQCHNVISPKSHLILGFQILPLSLYPANLRLSLQSPFFDVHPIWINIKVNRKVCCIYITRLLSNSNAKRTYSNPWVAALRLPVKRASLAVRQRMRSAVLSSVPAIHQKYDGKWMLAYLNHIIKTIVLITTVQLTGWVVVRLASPVKVTLPAS